MYNLQIQKISYQGGKIVHIYPLGYHPYSIFTKIADKFNLTKRLIRILRPEAYLVSGYKTYFDLGSVYELENFLKNHSSVAHYSLKFAYSGSDYFAAFAPLGIGIELFNRFCEIFKLKFFASNVIVDITINRNVL